MVRAGVNWEPLNILLKWYFKLYKISNNAVKSIKQNQRVTHLLARPSFCVKLKFDSV